LGVPFGVEQVSVTHLSRFVLPGMQPGESGERTAAAVLLPGQELERGGDISCWEAFTSIMLLYF